MAEARKKRRTALHVIVSIAIIWIALFVIASLIDRDDGSKRDGSDKIAIVPIIGEITTSGSSSFPVPSEGASSTSIINSLEKAEKDKNVRAIVLEINSPGGTVVASEEIANKVKSMEKPVVAWIREIGASGGYWIASGADSIVADPLSITGSIGVIGSYLEFSRLLDKYGIRYEGLTTGKYKDLGSPFKELTQEERGLLLSKMNIIHDAFVDEIARNRNMPRDRAESLSTGIFYIGKEAKEIGLVDKLGGKDVAIQTAKELAGIEDAEEIRYEERKGLIEILGQLVSYQSYYLGRGIGFEIANKLDNNRLEIAAI